MLKYLTQFTQTDRGQSAGRLGFLLTVGLSNAVTWLLVLFLTIKEMDFPAIPDGLVYVYGLAQGLSFAGKAAQSFADRKKGECNEERARKNKKRSSGD